MEHVNGRGDCGLGEVCFKPVFILKDLLKHVLFSSWGRDMG